MEVVNNLNNQVFLDNPVFAGDVFITDEDDVLVVHCVDVKDCRLLNLSGEGYHSTNIYGYTIIEVLKEFQLIGQTWKYYPRRDVKVTIEGGEVNEFVQGA